MRLRILVVTALLGISQILQAKEVFTDYAKIRDDLERERSAIFTETDSVNTNYIRAVNSYRKCDSPAWRAAFEAGLGKIDNERLFLDTYKKESLSSLGKLNSEWLETANENEISRRNADDDITDFVIWYRGHTQIVREGPLHEIELYNISYKKLTEILNAMADACTTDSAKASNFDVVVNSVTALLEEAFSIIGSAR